MTLLSQKTEKLKKVSGIFFKSSGQSPIKVNGIENISKQLMVF